MMQMHDSDPIGDKECGTACSLLVVSAACAIALIVFVVSSVSAADDPLCQYFDALAGLPGVEVATWIGYPDGWQDYPREWDYETITDLAGGAAIVTKAKGHERWLWGFRSLKEDNGHHDFCEHVLIVSEEP